MKSYPIWHVPLTCHYKADKSYGGMNDSQATIYVGSGSSVSEELVSHNTTKRSFDEWTYKGKTYKDVTVFKFGVDGKVLEIAVFQNRTRKEPMHLIKRYSVLTRMKGL